MAGWGAAGCASAPYWSAVVTTGVPTAAGAGVYPNRLSRRRRTRRWVPQVPRTRGPPLPTPTQRSEVKERAAALRGTPGAYRLQAVACGGLRDALAARSCLCRPDDPPAATRGGGGGGRRAKGTRHPGSVLCANRAGRGAAAPRRHLHDEQDALPVQRSPPTSATHQVSRKPGNATSTRSGCTRQRHARHATMVGASLRG